MTTNRGIRIIFLVFLVILHGAIGSIFGTDPDEICTFNLESFQKLTSPLIIDSSSKKPKFVYPTPNLDHGLTYDTKLEIRTGETVNLYCPGKPDLYHSSTIEPGTLEVNGVAISTETDKPLRCIGWDKFNTLDNELDPKGAKIEDFSCKLEHHSFDPILRPIDGERCGNDRYEKYEIGYDLGAHGFLRTIDLCHDKIEAKTLWAHHVMQPTKLKTDDPYKDGKFKKGMLYEEMDFNKKNPYDIDSVVENLKTVFDSDDTVKKYISPKVGKKLTGGQLISRLSKYYIHEVESTFFFANVVPMWFQVRNETGNWHYLQESLRKLVSSENRILDIWSGGFGILTLENGKKLYMDATFQANEDAEVQPKIPVPKYLYTCIVDKKHEEAICVVVLNNPYVYIVEVSLDVHQGTVCSTVRCSVDFLPHAPQNLKGFTFCCPLKDFYTKNEEHLGLEDIKPYLDYKELTYKVDMGGHSKNFG